MNNKKSIVVAFTYILIVFCFYSCGSNSFSFDENKQELISKDVYFSCIEIRGLNNDDFFVIRRKENGCKNKVINITKISNDYYITQNYNGDTLKINSIKLKRNCNYEILNRGIFDASPSKIIVYIDNDGYIKKQ
ncbi:MAG: hypothetical protein LBR28_07850 [Bacteroidales bacterium]|jgi:hypothetical protein|nr:hypothetical protein [Bacteroidales bacterium]